MALDAGFESFFENEKERFPESVGHVDGCGVVVGATSFGGSHVVVTQHGDVEIPALHFCCAGLHDFKGSIRERDGREAGRAGEVFLSAGVDGIDFPLIDFELVTAEGGDGIDEEEHVGLVDELGNFFERLVGSGGGLGMDDGEELGAGMSGQGFGCGFIGDDFAPGSFDGVNGGTAALHDILHPAAKDAIETDDGFVTGFEKIDSEGFHPSHSGAGNGEGHLVLGLINFAKHLAGFVHDLNVLRIEVPQGGGTHCRKNAGWHGAGARAHEDAFGGIELTVLRHMRMEDDSI